MIHLLAGCRPVRLGDEFFFVALDDRTGRPRLSAKVLALGLAGALLGELVFDGRISVAGDRVQVIDRRPHVHPPGVPDDR